jgi:peptidoglycan hydrolase-like protein with peptidoglycan-binding domain
MRPVLVALTLIALAATPAAAAAGAASRTGGTAVAQSAAPHLSRAVCFGKRYCGPGHGQVQPRAQLRVTGRRLASGMRVDFAAKPHGRVRSRLRRTKAGMLVTVPTKARTGRIRVLDKRGRRSNLIGPIRVVKPPKAPPAGPAAASSGTAFDGAGMWIWQLGRSSGGDPLAIAAQARAGGIGTVFVKSADGASDYAGQFTPALVQALKAQGLHVCAWQFVYGTNPDGEAAQGIAAVQAGADCLVVDAETNYEGKYAQAQRYMQLLRSGIGPDYAVGLTSFPYVHYHSSLPYSVFLGPGGAQFNLPQMYWKAIGTSVDAVFANTYTHNRIYGRPILPLGQTYKDPAAAELTRFRQFAAAYGATGISWWSWQETQPSEWTVLGQPLQPLVDAVPVADVPVLGMGAKGDEVVWMQEHLAAVVPTTPTNGVFDTATDQALRTFQSQRAFAVTGQTDAATWAALLALPPVAVDWTAGGKR